MKLLVPKDRSRCNEVFAVLVRQFLRRGCYVGQCNHSRAGVQVANMNETSVNANLMRTTWLFSCSWVLLLHVFCKRSYIFGGLATKRRVSAPVCFAKCLSVRPAQPRRSRSTDLHDSWYWGVLWMLSTHLHVGWNGQQWRATYSETHTRLRLLHHFSVG